MLGVVLFRKLIVSYHTKLWTVIGYHKVRDFVSCKNTFRMSDNFFADVLFSSAISIVSGKIVDDEQVALVLPLKRCVATFCHGNSGKDDVTKGWALCFWALALKHSGQFFTNSYNCRHSPGHQIDCRARSWHLVIPRWTVYVLCRAYLIALMLELWFYLPVEVDHLKLLSSDDKDQ